MPSTTSAANDGVVDTSIGKEAILKLKSTDPPLYISPSPDLSEAARLASEYLFSSLKPYAPKSPFTHLLVKGFDAEQIWQQIDIQSQPLISSLRRKVQNFEKNPDEIKCFFNALENGKSVEEKGKDSDVKGETEEFEDDDVIAFGNEDDDDEDEEDDDEQEEEEDNEDEEQKLPEKGEGGGVEDKFFKMDELEEYLEKDEAREYDINPEKKKGKKRGHDEIADEIDEDEGEEGEESADEEDDELGLMGLDDDEDDEGENARYQDFFGKNEKKTQKRKTKSVHVSDNLDMDLDEESSGEDNNRKKGKLSTHEKELERLRSKVEEMEKANIEPKSWTMVGEVTAANRPKNSALEVDLDIEHNVRPAPLSTQESAQSLEDIIIKKAMELGFDDPKKPPTLPSRAPREVKELDENKSKKGLGEIYEEEYAEKTGLVSVAVSISEQQKKEAKSLFKELCLKLDALSHFHFTPKPVIEDMSIQTNVPALAMEEIAPLAVSDAAMLAPEEVFAGKGDIKDETELTQAERKRRRANKKRKFKANAEKRVVKSQPTPQSNKDENDS